MNRSSVLSDARRAAQSLPAHGSGRAGASATYTRWPARGAIRRDRLRQARNRCRCAASRPGRDDGCSRHFRKRPAIPKGPAMTTQPTAAEVLVIQPCDDDALGRFEGWLTEHGIALHTVRPYTGDAVPARLAADGLIVLGGDMSSNDDAEYPWLEDIRALYRDAVRRDRPTLGICLGGQLLAQSLGGTVVTGAAGTEAGLVQVTLTAEAAGDPLFGGLAPNVPVASMHGDAIAVLPEDSVLLATGQTYPHQAFRAAPRAWGVQFH